MNRMVLDLYTVESCLCYVYFFFNDLHSFRLISSVSFVYHWNFCLGIFNRLDLFSLFVYLNV